jgi:hypothetical protein
MSYSNLIPGAETAEKMTAGGEIADICSVIAVFKCYMIHDNPLKRRDKSRWSTELKCPWLFQGG